MNFEELLEKAKSGDEQALEDLLDMLRNEQPPKKKIWGLGKGPKGAGVFGDKRWNRALDAFQEKAKAEDAFALYAVGRLHYHWGEFYESTFDAYPKHIGWYEKSDDLFCEAAERGHAGALYWHGLQLDSELGCAADRGTAVECWFDAAEKGHKDACWKLSELAKEGDERAASTLVSLDADLDGDDGAALKVLKAVRDEDLVSLKALLDAGANPNAWGAVTLMAAAENGSAATLRELLAAGVDVDAQTDSGETALVRATENGNLEVVKALLAAGAAPEAKDEFGRTPLINTVWDLELVKALLAAGADMNAADDNGRTALMRAAQGKKGTWKPHANSSPPGRT